MYSINLPTSQTVCSHICVSVAGTLGGGGTPVVKKMIRADNETSSTPSLLECTHSKMGRVMSSKTNYLSATVHVADTHCMPITPQSSGVVTNANLSHPIIWAKLYTKLKKIYH